MGREPEGHGRGVNDGMQTTLDDLFAAKPQNPDKTACRLCGKPTEAVLTVEVRRRNNGKYGRRLTRSLTVCGGCAVERYEALVGVLDRGSTRR